MDPRALLAATRGGGGATLEARPEPLLPGRALQVLLASPASEIAAAFSPLAPVTQSLARRALDSLVQHAGRRPGALQEDIVRPLLDLLVRHRAAADRAPALRVCGALMREAEVRGAMLGALGSVLEGNERALALGAVLLVEAELEMAHPERGAAAASVNGAGATDALPVGGDGSGGGEGAPAVRTRLTELTALAPALAHSASLAQPTRLACAAADVLVRLSGRCAELALADLLFALLAPLDRYLAAAHAWHADRPLLAAALPSVRRLVALLSAQAARAAALPPRLAAALCAEWAVLAPLLVLHPPPAARRQVRAALADVAAQAGAGGASEASFRALLSLALALGRLAPGERDEALRPLAPHAVAAALAHTAGAPEGRGVAIALLRAAAALVEEQSTLVEPLLALLSETDGVSEAVTAFLAEFSLRNLSNVLNPLFGLLERGDAAQRRNALAVIARIVADRPPGDAALTEELVGALAQRLGDAELQVRCAVAPLFASLRAERALPLLLALLAHNDDRLRSAAADALREVLCSQADRQEALAALGAHLDGTSDAAVAERAARAFGRAAESLAAERQAAVCTALLALTALRPASAALVKLFASAAPALGARHGARLVAALTARMQTQPRLTEDMLSAQGDESAQAVRSLLFARLSPLLLLRALPSSVLHAEIDSTLVGPLLTELRERVGRLYEFEEVRRLAAEVAAHLPGAGAMLFDLVRESHSAGHAHITRAALFGLCARFSLPGGAAGEADALCGPLVAHLLPLIARPPTGDAEEAKLRAGVTDCLATVARISLQRLGPGDALAAPVQEVEATAAGRAAGVAAVLPQMLQSLGEELRVALPGARTAPLGARMATAAVLAALCRLASPDELHRLLTLSLTLLGRVAAHAPAAVGVRATVLHALFAAAFGLGARAAPFARPLLDLALALAGADEAAVRLGALKVLGAVLPHAEDTLRAEPGLVLAVRHALAARAAADAAPDVQQLAAKVLALSGLADAGP